MRLLCAATKMELENDLGAALFPFPQDHMAPDAPMYQSEAALDGLDELSTADEISAGTSPLIPAEFDFISFPSPSDSWGSLDDVDESLQLPMSAMDWRFAAGASIGTTTLLPLAMRKNSASEDPKSESLSLVDVIPSAIGCCSGSLLAGDESVLPLARQLFAEVDLELMSDDEGDHDGFARLLTDSILAYAETALEGVVPAESAPEESPQEQPAAENLQPIFTDIDPNALYMSVQPMRKARAKSLNISTVKEEYHPDEEEAETETLASVREPSFDGMDSSSDKSSETAVNNNSPSRSSLADMPDVADPYAEDIVLSSDGEAENGDDWNYGRRAGSHSRPSKSNHSALSSPASSFVSSTRKRPRAKSAAARLAAKAVPAQPPQPRPYSCDFCSAAFIRKHDLKRHERIHLGEHYITPANFSLVLTHTPPRY